VCSKLVRILMPQLILPFGRYQQSLEAFPGKRNITDNGACPG
jgi:hypothetical protein